MTDKSKKTNKKKALSLFLNLTKFAITFGILAFLYSKGMLDFSRVKKVFTNPPIVIAAFSIMFSTTLASVLRWQALVVAQGLKISLREATRLTMIGVFFNTAIPGAVSGDVLTGYYVVRQQPNKKGRIKAFTTLLMDRILGLSALIFVSFSAMVLNFSRITHSNSLKSLSGFIALLFAGVLLFYFFVLVSFPITKKLIAILHQIPIFGEYIGRTFESFKSYEASKGVIAKGLLISVAIHCSIIGVFILISKSLGGFEGVHVQDFFFLVPFGLLVTAIPLAPAGLGTGHAAFLILFQRVGNNFGADLFTAFVSFQVMISLIGGLFYLKYREQHLSLDIIND